jgi:hypothetical protein
MMGSSEESVSAKNQEYRVQFSAADWKQKAQENRSDYVWENTKDGRILLSNSFCKEFQDQSLEVLASKTFKSVSEIKIEKKSYLTFQDREAYRLEGHGKVDGVAVGLILLNTRRNNCYFDFVSITPLEYAKESQTDFDNFLKSVEFK